MRLRIATFNVENLFQRPRAMYCPTWEEGQPALDDAHELNDLFNRETYDATAKARMIELLGRHGLLAARGRDAFLDLRVIRGQLVRRSRNGHAEIVARGRADWVGWMELKDEPIADEAIANTARVIAEVNPDVLVVVEVEDRLAVQRFYEKVVLPLGGGHAAPYTMVIQGVDERGINVGIASRWPIKEMRSHVADTIDGRLVFSRDCPEYVLRSEDGREIVVMPNHFASKGSDRDGARRRLQAGRVREIYEARRRTHELVVVAGDFNDYPAGGSLGPLLDSELRDAMSLPAYHGYPGTYRHGTEKEKLDYLLLSPKLAGAVTAVDVCRKGFYAPEKWESFESINRETKERNQASDHHCLWADIDLG